MFNNCIVGICIFVYKKKIDSAVVIFRIAAVERLNYSPASHTIILSIVNLIIPLFYSVSFYIHVHYSLISIDGSCIRIVLTLSRLSCLISKFFFFFLYQVRFITQLPFVDVNSKCKNIVWKRREKNIVIRV